ncbi:uncharacterized protein LOC111349639 [Spodoptera litura]|nr:uncharacterized protein LOC111349639 [Spodoptera litura]
MASNRKAMDDIIANWLEESDHNSDDNFSEDDSEIEDHVSDEDVQDDVEEGYIEDETIENSRDIRAEESVSSFVPENSESLEQSSSDRRILVPARRTLKGKNQHCWSTSKGESRGRTTAINIVYTSRGQFMKKLSTQLTTEWMQKRLEAPTLKRNIRDIIEVIL